MLPRILETEAMDTLEEAVDYDSMDHREVNAAFVTDLLVIENAGAYGFVMGSNYNSKPLAAEVLLRDDGAHLIRRRQSFEELMQGECIPE